jgi:hypothetical protein
MNCPGCDNPIVNLRRSCSRCGYDYGPALYDKFAFYFGLKNELAKLSDLQNSLYAGIANVSQKIQKYEAVLRRELTSLPAVKGKKTVRKQRRKT